MVHPLVIIPIGYLSILGINQFEKEIDTIGLYRTPKEKENVIKILFIGIMLLLFYFHKIKVIKQVHLIMDKKRIHLVSSQFK